MVGTWTPPGAIFTIEFDDEALTLKLLKRTSIPKDEPISWMTFDVSRDFYWMRDFFWLVVRLPSAFICSMPERTSMELRWRNGQVILLQVLQKSSIALPILCPMTVRILLYQIHFLKCFPISFILSRCSSIRYPNKSDFLLSSEESALSCLLQSILWACRARKCFLGRWKWRFEGEHSKLRIQSWIRDPWHGIRRRGELSLLCRYVGEQSMDSQKG